MATEKAQLEELLDQIHDLPDDDQAELAQMLIESRAEAYSVGQPDEDLTPDHSAP
jgi:hypothetical protein